MNVTPQPKEREQALTLNSKQLALSVEGFIETTNPRRIQKIIVYVHVNYADKENDPPVIDSRACEVCDNYFFKVNLLLNVAKVREKMFFDYLKPNSRVPKFQQVLLLWTRLRNEHGKWVHWISSKSLLLNLISWNNDGFESCTELHNLLLSWFVCNKAIILDEQRLLY